MTLSPGAKVRPNLTTLRSPAGFNAAWSSILRERAPTPPRFIGQRTWTSRIGSRPSGADAGFGQLDDARNCGLGIISFDKIEIALGFGFAKIGNDTLINAVGIDDDLALSGLPE